MAHMSNTIDNTSTTDPQTVIDSYFECWNATSDTARSDAIGRTWAPDAQSSDPFAEVTGHEQLATFRITDSTLPFKTADIAFTLTDSRIRDHTEVTVSPSYTLEHGPIGWLLDTVAVRRNYRAGMRDLLEGLKRHLEQHC